MARRLSKSQIEANKKLAKLRGEYGKERTRLMRAMGRMKKRGYDFGDYDLPPTPKKITKASVNRLKKITNNDLYDKAIYIDYETGEFVSGKQGKILEAEIRARKAQETKRLKRKAEQEFWSGSTTSKKDRERVSKEKLPNGGDIIIDNSMDEFILKLSQPAPQFTQYSSKRRAENYQSSERERVTLYSLTMNVIKRDGKSELGWRLQQSGDLVWELLQYVLYGSDSTAIASASRELAEIINGSTLSMSDYADLAHEQEMNEDFEYPQ